MYTAICICTYIHIYAWIHPTQLHALFFMLGRCHQQCFHITTLVTLSNVFNTAGRTNTAPTLSQQHETRICHGCVLRSSVPCGIPSVATKAFGRLPLSATSRMVDLGRKIYALSSTLLLYWLEPDGCRFFFSQVRKVQVNQSTSCRKCKPSKSVLPWAHRLKHGG